MLYNVYYIFTTEYYSCDYSHDLILEDKDEEILISEEELSLNEALEILRQNGLTKRDFELSLKGITREYQETFENEYTGDQKIEMYDLYIEEIEEEE